MEGVLVRSIEHATIIGRISTSAAGATATTTFPVVIVIKPSTTIVTIISIKSIPSWRKSTIIWSSCIKSRVSIWTITVATISIRSYIISHCIISFLLYNMQKLKCGELCRIKSKKEKLRKVFICMGINDV